MTASRAAGSTAALAAAFGIGAWAYLHVGDLLLQRAPTLPAPLLLTLALVGGAASFFSPCSIAITPSFLAYLLAGGDLDRGG